MLTDLESKYHMNSLIVLQVDGLLGAQNFVVTQLVDLLTIGFSLWYHNDCGEVYNLLPLVQDLCWFVDIENLPVFHFVRFLIS